MPWKPILDGDLAIRARAIVDEITSALVAETPLASGLDGAAGHACLFAYTGLEEHASSRLERAVMSAPHTTSPALWGGLAGIRFAVGHLAGRDDGTTAVLAVLDASLAMLLEQPAARGNFDLISGLSGIAIAALEEEDAGAGRVLAGHLVQRLELLACEGSWYSEPGLLSPAQRELHPEGHYNLGLAHGVPGVIGALARCILAGVEPARPLLARAVTWLLATAPSRGNDARFPLWIVSPSGNAIEQPSPRLAWCYGDLGVAVALLAAARATGVTSWEAAAVAIARSVAKRAATRSVRDMGICHGSAGLAHLLNRMYQCTGDVVLGDAARTWMVRTMDMRRPREPVAGFPMRNVDGGVECWVADAGILTGATGIALVLLAATSELEPGWDRVLGYDLVESP